MAHLSSTLPDRIEIGAVRRDDWGTEIVGTDAGTEVRNNRWAAPLRVWDVAAPLMLRTDDDYIALRALFTEAEGSLHSFDFTDPVDDEVVPVRFDGPLQMTAPASHLVHINFVLIEVK